MNKINLLNRIEIAELLYEKYPSQDPLKIRFTDLANWIRNLENFDEASGPKMNEKILEDIQMKWYEEFQLDQK